MQNRISSGYVVAVGGSIVLLICSLILVATSFLILGLLGAGSFSPEQIATRTPIGLIFALGWLGAVAGTATSFVAIAVYGFRARWFWNCLAIAAALLLAAPPVGTLIGVIALIGLFRFRKNFPDAGPMPVTPQI